MTLARGWRALAIALWALLAGGGSLLLAGYATAPGARGVAPARWPAASGLPHAHERATLLLFLHPRCPCSRATLAELARVVARAGEGLDVQVVFTQPAGAGADWTDGELWRDARALPGVAVRLDAGGVEAARFGALTSGHAVLYGRAGDLRFSGGITPARGHEGDNAGAAALLALAGGAAPTVAETDVYGCPLTASRSCPAPLAPERATLPEETCCDDLSDR